MISGEVLHDVKVLPWSPHKYALSEMDQGSDRREGFPCRRQCCFRHCGFREPLAISRPQIVDHKLTFICERGVNKREKIQRSWCSSFLGCLSLRV